MTRNYKFKSTYSSQTKTLRNQLIEERGNLCQNCKGKFFENIHHKDKNRKNNEPSNLMLLCRKCHSLEHARVRRIELGPLFQNNIKI